MSDDGQRTFDFQATERSERRAAELDAWLDRLGLNAAERRIVTYIWKHGMLLDNRSAVVVSLRRLAKAIGFGLTWTCDCLTNLIAWRVVAEGSNGPRKPKSYCVEWSLLKRSAPFRIPDAELDPFLAFAEPRRAPAEALEPEHADVSVPVSVAVSQAVPVPVPQAVPVPVSVAVSPQLRTSQILKPQEIKIKSNEGGVGGDSGAGDSQNGANDWGRAVSADELRTWEGRNRLWRRAREINPAIERGDYDEVAGFLAACLCASQQAESPPAMLLAFVRRRAWKQRGTGGIDGYWLQKATALLRERQRERDAEAMSAASE